MGIRFAEGNNRSMYPHLTEDSEIIPEGSDGALFERFMTQPFGMTMRSQTAKIGGNVYKRF